jgi:alcohol dehydrogenase class IV
MTPSWCATLPVPMTVTSALNAMAHAAEALYAVKPQSDVDHARH